MLEIEYACNVHGPSPHTCALLQGCHQALTSMRVHADTHMCRIAFVSGESWFQVSAALGTPVPL